MSNNGILRQGISLGTVFVVGGLVGEGLDELVAEYLDGGATVWGLLHHQGLVCGAWVAKALRFLVVDVFEGY